MHYLASASFWALQILNALIYETIFMPHWAFLCTRVWCGLMWSLLAATHCWFVTPLPFPTHSLAASWWQHDPALENEPAMDVCWVKEKVWGKPAFLQRGTVWPLWLFPSSFPEKEWWSLDLQAPSYCHEQRRRKKERKKDEDGLWYCCVMEPKPITAYPGSFWSHEDHSSCLLKPWQCGLVFLAAESTPNEHTTSPSGSPSKHKQPDHWGFGKDNRMLLGTQFHVLPSMKRRKREGVGGREKGRESERKQEKGGKEEDRGGKERRKPLKARFQSLLYNCTLREMLEKRTIHLHHLGLTEPHAI